MEKIEFVNGYVTLNEEEYNELIEHFIEEAIFAIMISYKGWFDPVLAKQILEEHFGVNDESLS
jgi:phosphosulfolactate synthase (CoM biosynthesis protein A)